MVDWAQERLEYAMLQKWFLKLKIVDWVQNKFKSKILINNQC